MKMYSVSWTMSYVAASPEQAAKIARQELMDPKSKASIFDVRDDKTGVHVLVDTESDPPRILRLNM